MKFLRDLLDKLEKPFQKGEKLEKLYPVYEMHDTILYTPGEVTKGTTHVKDALDLKRMMITVVVALLPCVFMAFYNTGYQANLAIQKFGASVKIGGWQDWIYSLVGLGHDPANFVANIAYGGIYFLPVFLAVFITGGIVEVTFAIVRNHEINEGFLVTGFLLPLTLPPTIPLWQAALGAAFGIVIGKEIFGGTGMNILNPALTGRAFLFFAYPAQISGDAPWIAANMAKASATSTLSVDAVSGATWLGKASAGAVPWGQKIIENGVVKADLTFMGTEWWNAFIGLVPGSMGETSALACLIGAAILIITGIGSWRTMLGVVVGTFAISTLLYGVQSDTNYMFGVPFYWHIVLGGWAFGAVFMATDPVSSAFTDTGKLIYGFGIGAMVVLVRVVNPAYPEGMMLAILFMNMFAPLIDHFFVQANIKRRLAHHAV